MAPDETEQAIRRPAEGVGVSVEPGVLAEIIADVTHQPGAPLLQYGLTELFERRDGDRLTLTAYHEIGGVAGPYRLGPSASSKPPALKGTEPRSKSSFDS